MGLFPPWNCGNGLFRAWLHLNVDSASERKTLLFQSTFWIGHTFSCCALCGECWPEWTWYPQNCVARTLNHQRQGRVGDIVLSGKHGKSFGKRLASVCCNLLCFFLVEEAKLHWEGFHTWTTFLSLRRNSLSPFLRCHEEATSKFILPWRVFKLSWLHVKQRQRK